MSERFKPDATLVTRRIADETILVPVKGTLASLQQVYVLNGVAAFIWERLDGQRDVETILSEVVTSFEVDLAQARLDLEEFVATLEAAGLVVRAAAAPSSDPG